MHVCVHVQRTTYIYKYIYICIYIHIHIYTQTHTRTLCRESHLVRGGDEQQAREHARRGRRDDPPLFIYLNIYISVYQYIYQYVYPCINIYV